MLKTEMEIQLRAMHTIAGQILSSFRDSEGRCEKCEALQGQYHRKGCPAWILIEWRKKNHGQGLFGAERINLETPDDLI